MNRVRVGHGYDVHAFDAGDGFVVGGVFIPCDKSVVAHSDGDVLIHALCDAILGALGRGDIGQMFADTDAANRNRDSREFLRLIGQLMIKDGYQLGNADATIIAQVPKMAPHLFEMQRRLAKDLGTIDSRVNIKATTTEKLGFIGLEQGLAAEAVVLLEAI